MLRFKLTLKKMSKQKIFTPEFVDFLRNSVEDNIENYKNPDFDWAEFAVSNNGLKAVPLTIPSDLCGRMLSYVPPEDAKNKALYDFEAAKLLFESFPNLTPLQVAQRGLWTYLSHVVLMPYMRKRWVKIDTDADLKTNYVDEHWLYGAHIARSWIHGMYWSVYSTVQRTDNPDEHYDYSLTEILFSHQNIRVRGVAAAPFLMSNRAPLVALMKFVTVHNEDIFNKYLEYRVNEAIILLNNAGGVIDLTAWDENDFFDYLERCKDVILAVTDRKKQRREKREHQSQNVTTS